MTTDRGIGRIVPDGVGQDAAGLAATQGWNAVIYGRKCSAHSALTMRNACVRLETFDDAHLLKLMSWFPDRISCHTWGGVEFRFPFTEASFREDAKLSSLPSWALFHDHGALAGFGQFYLRVGRCHLGRLAIAPDSRGMGLGSTLVRELCRRGAAALGVASHSLFVIPENARALRLYQRLGFAPVPYPEPTPALTGYIYMVASRLAPARS